MGTDHWKWQASLFVSVCSLVFRECVYVSSRRLILVSVQNCPTLPAWTPLVKKIPLLSQCTAGTLSQEWDRRKAFSGFEKEREGEKKWIKKDMQKILHFSSPLPQSFTVHMWSFIIEQRWKCAVSQYAHKPSSIKDRWYESQSMEKVINLIKWVGWISQSWLL